MKTPPLPARFKAYVATQSLGAFNDNVFKMLLQLYVLQVLVAANSEEIISQATFVFTVPFVLFGPWSGYFADKYRKDQLMRLVKIAEIGVMLLGVAAFYFGNVNFMLFILFLMATQSTFFAPAKSGIIPEICEPESITHANSWVSMTTFVFIILGTATAGLLMSFYDNKAMVAAYYCIGFAVLGAFTSFFIPKAKTGIKPQKFPWNPVSGIVKNLAFLKSHRELWLAALANSYFWLLGLIFSTNILVYGKKQLGIGESGSYLLSLLPAFIGLGIAAGSVLAGRWSGKKIEIGLVPLGGIGLTFTGIVLYFTTGSYAATAVMLFFGGMFGGLYIVPLNALLQYKSDENEKGRVLSTSGVLNGLFLVLGSLIYYLFAVQLQLSADVIYLIMGLVTALAVVYISKVIPEYFFRFCIWLLAHTFYKITIKGDENIPFKGPALLVPNHVSFIDAFLIGSTMQRLIRFIMLKSYYDIPFAKMFFRIMDVIPIAPKEGRESVTKSLDAAKDRLQNGHVVCIFPEGALTRDGELKPFKTGFESIMEGMDCPIIPIYLDNIWGSIFSFEGGKALFKFPKKIPYPVTIHYGRPLPPSAKAPEVEEAVKGLAANYNIE